MYQQFKSILATALNHESGGPVGYFQQNNFKGSVSPELTGVKSGIN
jgi:hypothetical protein